MKRSKNATLRSVLYIFSFFLVIFSMEYLALGDDGGGRRPQPAPPGPLPPASVTALPFDGPAPWGTNPSAIPGATISGAITGNGFVQEIVTLPSGGGSFWYQSISAPDGTFLSESYVKKVNAFQNCPPGVKVPGLCPNGDPTGSPSPTGNVIFNVLVKDPATGMTGHAWMNGFNQPISLHSDVVDLKAQGAVNVSGFNEMDMHFSQIPFKDTNGQILVRQDVGVWITSLAGAQGLDVTENQRFIPGPGNLLRHAVTAADLVRRRGSDDGGRGPIDFWNDIELVKIVNPTTQQIVTYSKCDDFGDPTGRLEEFFRNQAGSRGGCSGGGSVIISPKGDDGGQGIPRPAIPGHSADNFQLTPIDWSRWGAGGAMALNSGGPGGFGGVSTFPAATSSRGGD